MHNIHMSFSALFQAIFSGAYVMNRFGTPRLMIVAATGDDAEMKASRADGIAHAYLFVPLIY